MARLGQRTQAGEALALAGEAEMQAGNFVLTNGAAAGTNRNDTMIAAGVFRIVYQGQARIVEGADVARAVGQIVGSRLDTAPPGELPASGMRDVWMYQTTDDGNIYPEDGDLYRTDGLETAVYLSAYGGNVADDGSEGNRLAWWGNDSLEDRAQRMTSRFQHLVDGIPLTSGNILRLEDALAADLAWLGDIGYPVEVSGRIVGINRLKMTVNVDGEEIILTN